MNYSLPKVQEQYYLDGVGSDYCGKHYDECYKTMKKPLASHQLMIQNVGNKGTRFHGYGVNGPSGASGELQLGLYLGALLNTRCGGVTVSQLMEVILEVVILDENSQFKGFNNDSKFIVGDLDKSFKFLSTLANPSSLEFSNVNRSNLTNAIKTLASAKMYKEDTLNAAMFNSIIGYVNIYSLVWLSDITWKLKYKKHNLISALKNSKIEDVFSSYLKDELIVSSIENLKKVGKVDASDIHMGVSGIKFDQSFYEKLLDASFEIMLDKNINYSMWLEKKAKFTRDRNTYSLIHTAKSYAKIEVSTDLDLTIGFNEGKVDMTPSTVSDFMENFNSDFANIIPKWKKFVSDLFINGIAYLLPSSKIRTAIIDGKETIYSIGWLNPYLDNNFLFKKDVRPKRIADLETALSDVSEKDSHKLTTYTDKDSNFIPAELEDLIRLYSRHTAVERMDLETREYLVRYDEMVKVIYPPSGIQLPKYIEARPKMVGGSNYMTIPMNYKEMSLLDLYFYVRDSDVEAIESIYLKRLDMLGSSYSVGKKMDMTHLDTISVGVTTDALFYATLSRLPAENYARSADINFDLPKNFQFGRLIELAENQYISFPIAKDNLSEAWYSTADDLDNDFKGTDEFSISKKSYSNIFGDYYTGKVKVELSRDVSFPHFAMVGSEEGKTRFLYAPELAPQDRRYTLHVLGDECLHDYYEVDPTSGNALDLVIRMLMSIYIDCSDGIAVPTLVKERVSGIVGFLKYLNPAGQIHESGSVPSNITWGQLSKALQVVSKTEVSKKTNDEICKKYIDTIFELFDKEKVLWGKFGYRLEQSILGDTKKALLDKHNGIVRAVNSLVTAVKVFGTVSLPGLKSTDGVRNLILARLNRRVESAMIQQINQDVKRDVTPVKSDS